MMTRKKPVARKSKATQSKAARRKKGRVRLDVWLGEEAAQRLDELRASGFVAGASTPTRSAMIEWLIERTSNRVRRAERALRCRARGKEASS